MKDLNLVEKVRYSLLSVFIISFIGVLGALISAIV
jgi:hypothetical protein